MNRRRLAGILATISVTALIAGYAASGKRAEPHTERKIVEARGDDSPQSRLPQSPTPRAEAKADGREKSPFQHSARSLRGTSVDGALRVSPEGDLIVGPEVLRLFDYFFTTEGEESDATIRARILAAIRERVDGPAALQAAALLDRYLAYRKDSGAIALPKDKEADPKARLEAIRELRTKHFGDDAEKLFGDEEREGEVAIEESRIRQDDSLSDEQKAEKIAALEDKLPEGAREARGTSTLPIRAREEEAAMRAEGASSADIRAYREATFGAEAADRLSALDAERAAWKERVESFKKEREALAERGLDEDSFAKAEQALLDRSFTPLEQRRVRATLAMQAR